MIQPPVGPYVSQHYLDLIAQRIAKKQTLEISIMGKDAYPGAKTNIPFCKPNWLEMNAPECSGKDVLLSLGVDLQAAEKMGTPEQFFCWLLEEHGIAFLNVSYHFIGELKTNKHGKDVLVSSLGKEKHARYLIHAEQINRDILRNSKVVLLLGDAKKHHWYGEAHHNAFEVVHPDHRCRNSRYPHVRQTWQDWWSPNQVATRFRLDITVQATTGKI